MQGKEVKRLGAAARAPLELPTQGNQIWIMNFTKDLLASGWNFRTLG